VLLSEAWQDFQYDGKLVSNGLNWWRSNNLGERGMIMGRCTHKWQRIIWFQGLGSCLIAAIVLVMVICGSANAFVIIDEEDLGLRWDNTFRYNYGLRTRSPQGCILNSPNYDDGDRNFDKGTVSNRLDILSELNVTYKKNFGFRVSAAFWYDQQYRDSLGEDSRPYSNYNATPYSFGNSNIGLPDQTKRWHRGPDGEVLDALVFGRVEVGGVPLSIKVGRHTIYWGESLLTGGAFVGISYAQMPIDLAKALAVPGTEVKELFRPLGSVSAQAQLTNTISLMGQYFFQWQPYRFPQSGSYLGFIDLLQNGGQSLWAPTGMPAPYAYINVPKGSSPEPDGTKNWGASLRWTPAWLGGSLGVYYRRYADMLPQTHLVLAVVGESVMPSNYFFTYPDEIDLYGISVSTQIMDLSIGAEVSYRKNTPLLSDTVLVLPGMSLPGKGETYGARGNNWQGLINFMGLIAKTPLFDSAVWLAEFTWSHCTHVSSGYQYFLGKDRGYTEIDAVTSHAFGAAVNFTPTWYQIFPGMDLSMPMSYSRGLSGNSALNSAIEENNGSWSIALSLDVYQKYKFNLTYAGYFGDITEDSSGGIDKWNGTTTLLKDRDTLSFTFKTTF
jgi:hypothetical protein